MKTLAHFTLEGLLRQGSNEVWIPLGTYESSESAALAACNPSIKRPGIVETRVLPLFRDNGATTVMVRKAEQAVPIRTHQPVTVA